MRKILMAAALAVGTASMSTPAMSQIQVPSGLVNVTVGDVILNRILSDNEIDILRNANVLSGNNVAVPVAVAAAVCNIPVAVLAQQKGSGGGCTADATNGDTTQLANLLRRRARQAR
jgi:hypothetical protein